jgi:predicted lipid-binding transport protein (Tim44 family)
MNDGLAFIDILIFAMIAAFLVYRLRSVLGRRTGEERQRPNPFSPQPTEQTADNVVQMPPRGPATDPAIPSAPGEPVSLAQGLVLIRQADPSFDEKIFMEGAKGAFAMIVGAFAQGDTAALRPLLADDVYENFARAIRERQSAEEMMETRVDRFEEVDLLEARMDVNTALVTIRFASHQISVTRDPAGTIVDGDPERAVEVIDIWTFARNTRSRDPNWLLVETRVPN